MVKPFTARYDLCELLHPASFDFFYWMAYVKQLGANRISFQSKQFRNTKWSSEEARMRYRTIVLPGAELGRMPYDEKNDGERIVVDELMHEFAIVSEGFERFTTIKPPHHVQFTVTMRNYNKNPHRNSDIDMWRTFAENINAHVIEDHFDEPIHLHDRMAIYAGARMNYGVVNGPMAILFLTPYPVTMCNCLSAEKGFAGHRIFPSDQLKFALPNQRMIWERPTLDRLLRYHDSIL